MNALGFRITAILQSKEFGMTRQSDKPGDLRQHRPSISAALALLTLLLLGTPLAAATPPVLDAPHFKFEQQAQEHCPSDSIVWAIARLGIFNSATERWYGQTNDGTYVCRNDAETAGYHAAAATR
jgi:hypothetical protein